MGYKFCVCHHIIVIIRLQQENEQSGTSRKMDESKLLWGLYFSYSNCFNMHGFIIEFFTAKPIEGIDRCGNVNTIKLFVNMGYSANTRYKTRFRIIRRYCECTDM